MIERHIDATTYPDKQAGIEVKELPGKTVILRSALTATNGAPLLTSVRLDEANARRLRDALTTILDGDNDE